MHPTPQTLNPVPWLLHVERSFVKARVGDVALEVRSCENCQHYVTVNYIIL